MSTPKRRRCLVDAGIEPLMAKGPHDLVKKLTGRKCHGAGHCIAETALFTPKL